MGVRFIPDPFNPWRGVMEYTGDDKEKLLDEWLEWAFLVSFRPWSVAFVAWLLNTP